VDSLCLMCISSLCNGCFIIIIIIIIMIIPFTRSRRSLCVDVLNHNGKQNTFFDFPSLYATYKDI